MSEAVYKHVVVSGKKFEKAKIVLDNMRFDACEFRDCDVFYSGGPVQVSSCYFENIRWHFQGAAALTVETIQALGWKILPPGS